jgi:isopentenyldiphosphate isomerase
LCVVNNQDNTQSCFFCNMMKKYIRETFFNPILHILPVLIFLVLDDVYGNTMAWLVSLPVALLLFGYVLIYYKSIYRWHLFSTSVYLLIGLIISVFEDNFIPEPLDMVFGELVAATFTFFLVLFKSFFYRMMVSVTSKRIAMLNNLNELIRTVNIVTIILLAFVFVYLIDLYLVQDSTHFTLNFIYQLYVLLLILLIIYEFIRVSAVRGRLLKEEWLPIVTEGGQEIGSTQQEASLSEPKKYIHPMVRVIVIEGNRIFLRKNTCKKDIDGSKWDNAICSHLRLKEDIPQCIRRSSEELYGITDINPVFLSGYYFENSCERQYVHLFVSCRLNDIHPNPELSDAVKWWTLQQINEELESGIFTDNFLKEYEILQRSGLIDTGRCSCECKLRDEIDSRI